MVIKEKSELCRLNRILEENKEHVNKSLNDLSKLDKELKKHEEFKKQTETALKELKDKKPGWARLAEGVITVGNLVGDPCIQAIVTDGENFKKYADALEKLCPRP